jgi:predicted thioesterase
MRGSPRIGATGEQQFVVEPKHAIDFADARMPAVLSTPWLIWFLEHAAREAVLPHLSAGESTVGTLVEVRHLAATPVGRTVRCVARVVHAEGRTISFSLEARDEHEVISRGFHKLHIINVDRFAQRIREKEANHDTLP